MEFSEITEKEFETLPHGEMEYAGSVYESVMDEEAFDLLCELCDYSYEGWFNGVYQELSLKRHVAARYKNNPQFKKVLARVYEHMIACGDVGACCNLANMFHDTSSQGSAEDYAKAIELYNLGGSRGDVQSVINLAYIYYYGRGVARDYARAYELYARAALLGGEPEAYWKLGDLYASGKFVDKSDWCAYKLYSKAYKKAGDSPLKARGAHHMADYLLYGIGGMLEPDPDEALRLYNEAEIGYYELIDSGLTYYQRQLEQAIAGQAEARQAAQEKHRRIRNGEQDDLILRRS